MSFLNARLFGSRTGRVAGLILACGGLFACAVAAAPMAGPVAGDVAGGAVEKSGDILRAGKAQSYQPVAIDDMIAVARRAAGELDLRQVDQEKHPDQIKLKFEDQRKQEITVTLVQRTYKATEIHVDVGMLGNNGMGDLMLRQMLRDIPKPESPASAGTEKPADDARSAGANAVTGETEGK